jgi:hypothetical protein
MDAEGDPRLFKCPVWHDRRPGEQPTADEAKKLISRRKELIDETLAGCRPHRSWFSGSPKSIRGFA